MQFLLGADNEALGIGMLNDVLNFFRIEPEIERCRNNAGLKSCVIQLYIPVTVFHKDGEMIAFF